MDTQKTTSLLSEGLKLQNAFPKVFEVLNTYMEIKKMRKTNERFFIIHEIYKFTDHFDADSLYQAILKSDYNISKATIYNNLDLFLDCGLIIKHNFGKNLSLYEKALGHKQHDHFICKYCQQIIEFCDPRLYQIKVSLEEILKVKIDNHSLYLFGVCSNSLCQYKAKPN